MSILSTTLRLGAPVLALALLVPSAFAAERGTAEEAQALVAQAIALYDADGREAAFAVINDREGSLVDRDLYIFVYGPDRTIVAHGGNVALIGARAADLSDVDGVPFADMFMDEATAEGVWIDYKWADPTTGEVLPKTSWVVLHDDGHVFGAGIYKTE